MNRIEDTCFFFFVFLAILLWISGMLVACKTPPHHHIDATPFIDMNEGRSYYQPAYENPN